MRGAGDPVRRHPGPECPRLPGYRRAVLGAGLYPYEGTFTYAVNKDTGEKIWSNDGVSLYYGDNPHGTAEGFNGNSPQGYLCTAQDNKVLVPNGRNLPACFDRQTGTLLYHNRSMNGAGGGDGGYHVVALNNRFYANALYGAQTFDLANSKRVSQMAPAGLDEDRLQITAGTTVFSAGRIFGYLSDYNTNGKDLYGGPAWNDSKFGVTGGKFHVDLPVRPAGLLAANGRLIVTTVDGWIYCYGSGTPLNGAKTYGYTPAKPATASKATDILTAANYKSGSRGICILLGLSDGALMEALASAFDPTAVAFETDAAKVQAVRQRLDAVGLDRKASIVTESFATADVPPYCAEVIASENAVPADAALATQVYRALRPYGGTAVVDGSLLSGLQSMAPSLPNAKVASSGSFTTLTKV